MIKGRTQKLNEGRENTRMEIELNKKHEKQEARRREIGNKKERKLKMEEADSG